MYDLIVVGGGAAGFFAAISAAEDASAPVRTLILEQGRDVLQKVRISGGGRCNVTHAEFDPRLLTTHYPRGARELRGAFHRFAPGDTIDWFERAGVPLKVEADGRVFPVSDSSESIVTALTSAACRLGVEIRLSSKVESIDRTPQGFAVRLLTGQSLTAKQLVLATGSAPKPYAWLRRLGLPVVDPVPSLFSFNIKDADLHALMGLSMPDAKVTLPGLEYETQGSLLVTHWGLSGPAILKMSAKAALELYEVRYRHPVLISWTGAILGDQLDYLRSGRVQSGKATLRSDLALGLPRRLWDYLVMRAGVPAESRWADLNKAQLLRLATALAADRYPIDGQTRFKEEFVTAGGLALEALDFKRFAVKATPGLYVVGELLNVDGVTGGFNFQAAWTGGHLAGRAVAQAIAPGQ